MLQPGDALRTLDDAARGARDASGSTELSPAARAAMATMRRRAADAAAVDPVEVTETIDVTDPVDLVDLTDGWEPPAPAPEPVAAPRPLPPPPPPPPAARRAVDRDRIADDATAVLRDIEALTAGARTEIAASVQLVDRSETPLPIEPVRAIQAVPAIEAADEFDPLIDDEIEIEVDDEPELDGDEFDGDVVVEPFARFDSLAAVESVDPTEPDEPVAAPVPPINLIIDAESFARSFATAIAPLLDDRSARPASVTILPSQIAAPVIVPKRSFWANSWHPDVLLSVVAMIIIMIVLVAFAV